MMLSHGFQWPETLNCDQLPKFSEQHSTGNVCAAPPDATSAPDDEASGPDLFKNRINSGGWGSNDEIKGGISTRVRENNKCKCQCTAPFRLVSSENSAISTQIYRVQNVSHCSYSCDGLLMPPTKAERTFMQKWMLILWVFTENAMKQQVFRVVTSFSVSLFTVITFCIDLSRFPYPERPILFLAFCQCAMSLGFIVQLMQGNETKVGCDGEILRTLSSNLLLGNSSTLGCLGVFFLLYYFGMSSGIWWVVLSLRLV